MELSRHAIEKLQTYGVEVSVSRHGKLLSGIVIGWESRPWMVIMSNNVLKDLTTYPTDDRTVTNRRGAGRWIFLNT